MTSTVFPDLADLKSVAADYCDTLLKEGAGTIDKAAIVSDCAESFAQPIAAWRRIDASGYLAEQIWLAFLRDLLLTNVRLSGALPAHGPGDLLH